MRRPLFNFLAVTGAVLLAAIGVSAHAQGGGTNLFAAFTDFTKTTLQTDVTTDTTGGSEVATGTRENENDQAEAPEANPAPEPAEAPDQDNDSQGEDNDEQGDDDNGGAAAGGGTGGDDGGGGSGD